MRDPGIFWGKKVHESNVKLVEVVEHSKPLITLTERRPISSVTTAGHRDADDPRVFVDVINLVNVSQWSWWQSGDYDRGKDFQLKCRLLVWCRWWWQQQPWRIKTCLSTRLHEAVIIIARQINLSTFCQGPTALHLGLGKGKVMYRSLPNPSWITKSLLRKDFWGIKKGSKDQSLRDVGNCSSFLESK